MSKEIARITDSTFGYCSVCETNTPGKISSVNATKTYCENKLIAATGDIVSCDGCGSVGSIDDTGSSVIVENKKMARINDSYSGVYSGSIISGASISYEGGA